jgi:hypothetical protein
MFVPGQIDTEQNFTGLASNSRTLPVPWTLLSKRTADLVSNHYLPPATTLRDPSKMKKDETTVILAFWLGRQKDLPPRDVFQFSHYLRRGRNTDLIPAEYPMSMVQGEGMAGGAQRTKTKRVRPKNKRAAGGSKAARRQAPPPDSTHLSESGSPLAVRSLPAAQAAQIDHVATGGVPSSLCLQATPGTRMEVLLTPRRRIAGPEGMRSGERSTVVVPLPRKRPPGLRHPIPLLTPTTPTPTTRVPTTPMLRSRPRPRPKAKTSIGAAQQVDNSDELFIRRRR